MTHFLAPTLAYLAPSIYLLSLGFLSWRNKRNGTLKGIFSTLQHGLLLIVMLTSNIYFDGVYASLRSLGLSVVLFTLLLISNILSKNGTFTIPIALSALPVMTWVGILPGFLAIIILAIVKMTKRSGLDSVKGLLIDTTQSLGAPALLSGNSLKVSLTNLPIPGEEEESVGEEKNSTKRPQKTRLNFSLYLGYSLACVGVLSYFMK